VFLGVIAVATLATAIMQIVALLAATRLVRRLQRLADTVETEFKPLLGQLNAVGRDTARVASLVSAQVERIDHLTNQVATRFEETVNTVHSTVRTAARGGTPFLLGLRAALSVFANARRRRGRSAGEEDDALFI
jgi:hypothetical protein